jgi:hypothetical protein
MLWTDQVSKLKH